MLMGNASTDIKKSIIFYSAASYSRPKPSGITYREKISQQRF